MSEYTASTHFIDLSAQQKLIRPKIDLAIKKVLDHGQYIMGPEVSQFENNLKEFTGSKHAFTCANGTDALSLVLMAWNIGPGDAVFVPSFTYIATAESPAQLGATPFFLDVDKNTFNMDPSSLKQAIQDCKKLGLNPSVVIPVDLFGQPADVDTISNIAHENKMKVLIDGAQSFGGMSFDRRVGSMGDATTTSFFPAKPLGCYGDGGAVFTQDDYLAEKINSLRLHGKGEYKYDNIYVGLNSRLDTMQAAILIEKLKIFSNELKLRQNVADRYTKGIKNKDITPFVPKNMNSAWAQYTLKIHNRTKFQEALKEKNIPTVIYYPIPLSLQKGYSKFPTVSLGDKNAIKLSEQVVSLPMYPYLSAEMQDKIIDEVNKII